MAPKPRVPWKFSKKPPVSTLPPPPTPGGNSKQVRITATFAGSPTNPRLRLADMLADASLAIVLHKDDSVQTDLTEVVANVKDLSTPDNAGGRIAVGVGFAKIAGAPTQDPVHQSPESSTTWPEYRSIYSMRQFAPVNHSQNHALKLPTWKEEFAVGAATVLRETGRTMTTMVPVAGGEGQVEPCLSELGYDLALSEGYNNNAAGRYQADIWWGERIPINEVADDYIVSSRWRMDNELQKAGFGNLSAWADDKIATAKFTKIISPIYGHAPYVGQGVYLRGFLLSIMEKAAAAGVKLWFPNPQQVSDFIYQRRRATVSAPVVSGNTVTWLYTPADERFYQDMSFFVEATGAALQGVTVEGAGGYTANVATGLLNVTKLKGEGVSTQKPRLTGDIPVRGSMEFISEQAPATDYFSPAFDPTTTVNQSNVFYNGKFRTADNQILSYSRHTFRPGQDPEIAEIKISDPRTNVGFNLRIFEVRKDGSQRELIYYTGGSVTKAIVPPTARNPVLRYQLIGANAPSVIRLRGPYTAVDYAPLPPRTMYDFAGACLVHCHYFELANQAGINRPVYDLWKRFGGGRVYLDAKRINNEEGYYIFNIDHAGLNVDRLLQQMKVDNLTFVLDVKELPDWLYNKYTGEDRSATGGTREWPPVNPPYANRLSMEAWAWARELAYNLVGRYGSNKNLDPATLKARTNQLYPGNPNIVYTKEVGLGVLKILEIWNEMEKDWKGIKVYSSGAEYAYFAYSIWLGVQDADPSVQISCTGLAAVTPDWLMDAVETMAKIAPLNADGTPFIPWDFLQVHAYSNSGSGQQNTSEKTRAMMPEISSLGKALDRLQEANARFLGNKPIIFGEIGTCWKINYNTDGTINPGQSPYLVYPPAGSPYTQKEWQGIHYLRTAFYLNFRGGIQYVSHYQLTDDSPSTPYQNYSTMGIIENVTGPDGVSRPQYRPNGNLLVQARELLAGYKHVERLSPTVNRLQNAAGKSAYVIYSETETGATAPFSVSLPGVATRYDLSLSSTTPASTPVPAGTYTGTATELPFVVVLT